MNHFENLEHDNVEDVTVNAINSQDWEQVAGLSDTLVDLAKDQFERRVVDPIEDRLDEIGEMTVNEIGDSILEKVDEIRDLLAELRPYVDLVIAEGREHSPEVLRYLNGLFTSLTGIGSTQDAIDRLPEDMREVVSQLVDKVTRIYELLREIDETRRS